MFTQLRFIKGDLNVLTNMFGQAKVVEYGSQMIQRLSKCSRVQWRTQHNFIKFLMEKKENKYFKT